MRFMLTFTWKQPPGDEVMALMPAEQARTKELMDQGIAEPAEMAADRSTLWAVWNCASQDEVEKTLQTLPMYEYLNTDITALGADE